MGSDHGSYDPGPRAPFPRVNLPEVMRTPEGRILCTCSEEVQDLMARMERLERVIFRRATDTEERSEERELKSEGL